MSNMRNQVAKQHNTADDRQTERKQRRGATLPEKMTILRDWFEEIAIT